MTYVWARWLADALHSSPRLAGKVVEVPGWEWRGRPPSRFSFLPSGLMAHHTACGIRRGHDPQWCANAIVDGVGSTPGPIAQLLGTWNAPGTRWDGRNLDPHIMVLAAGRSNHAGSGEYRWGAPAGNGSSIGIEWCGPPGEDERWPEQVTDFYLAVVDALLAWNGWSVEQVTTHWEYARPRGRKVDPSGAWRDQMTLRRDEPWNPDVFRAGVAAVRVPPIETNGGDMIGLRYQAPAEVGTGAFTGFLLGEFLAWQFDGVAFALDERLVSETVDVNEFARRTGPAIGVPGLTARDVLLATIRSRGTTTAPPPVVRSDGVLWSAWRAAGVTDAARSSE